MTKDCINNISGKYNFLFYEGLQKEVIKFIYRTKVKLTNQSNNPSINDHILQIHNNKHKNQSVYNTLWNNYDSDKDSTVRRILWTHSIHTNEYH